MKNKNSKIEKMKIIAAQRLSEVMSMKGMNSPAEIIKALEEDYSYPVQRQTFYKYQKGINSMPHDFIKKVSDILGIDSGYLDGKDSFTSCSYQEYENDILEINVLNSHNDDFARYNNLLKCADMLLSSATTSNNSDVEYSVTRKDALHKHHRYSSDEIEQHYQKCINMIRQSFCPDDNDTSDNLKEGDPLD